MNQYNLDLGSGKHAPAFNISITVETIITNPNHMDLKFETIDVWVSNPKLPTYRIGHTQFTDLYLPKDSKIPLIVPISLVVSLDIDTKGLVVQDFIKSCSRPANATKPVKPLTMNIRVEPVLRITSLIRIPLSPIQTNPSFNCPLNIVSSINIGGITVDLTQIDWAGVAQGKF